MSDWDFLHEMRESGYSSKEIADAAGCGVAPWDLEYVTRDWLDSQFENESEVDAFSAKPGQLIGIRDRFPCCLQTQGEIFIDLIDCAIHHYENTGRYLQVWGELGEIYAEIRFGLRRHETHRAGSDGEIAGKLVEVKTISPEKNSDCVLIKRKGNFEQVLIVRINRNFQFQGKLFDRSELKESAGKFLRGRLKDDPSNS